MTYFNETEDEDDIKSISIFPSRISKNKGNLTIMVFDSNENYTDWRVFEPMDFKEDGVIYLALYSDGYLNLEDKS